MQIVQGTTNTFAVVRSVLKDHGIDLSPEGEALVASKLTGSISISDGKAFIATPDEAQPSQELWTYLAGLLNKPDTARLFVVSKAPANAEAGISTNPFPVNPFAAEYRNVTRQMVLERKAPALAARLRDEAARADARIKNAGDPNNPFSRAGWNLTRQMQMMRADPELAMQMEMNANG
jgi:hypothetical protein